MGQRALKYGAGLIATYLAVAHATGLGNLLTKGSAGISGIVKTFQARDK